MGKKNTVRYEYWYVKDPSIPKGSEGNQANQLSKSFTNRFSMFWFILTDSVARAALNAGRCQFIDITD